MQPDDDTPDHIPVDPYLRIDPHYSMGEIFYDDVLVGEFVIEKSDLLNRLLVFDPLETILQFFPELQDSTGQLTIEKKDLIERVRHMGLVYEDWLARVFLDVLVTNADKRDQVRQTIIPQELELLRELIKVHQEKALAREAAKKRPTTPSSV